MAFSGEGNLIEAVVTPDANRTVIPVVCDATGHLLIGTGPGSTVTVVQPVGTNLHAVVDSGTVSATQGTVPWTVAGVFADGATANPSPVVIGGVNPEGLVRRATVDDSLGYQNIYTVATPLVADSVEENKIYALAVDVTAATSGANNPMVYLRNPNASGKRIALVAILAGTAVNNVSCTFQIAANPTVTVLGASQTPISRNVGGGAAAAVALLTTLPTVTVAGATLVNFVQGQNSNSVNLLAAEYSLIIQPNNAVLLTAKPDTNNRLCSFSMIWMEY